MTKPQSPHRGLKRLVDDTRQSGLTRRVVLEGMVAVGSLTGLAGCNQTDEARSSPEAMATESAEDTPSQTSSETVARTATATETPFQIDPVEHDKLVGAFYYPWYHGEDGIPGFTDEGWLGVTPGEPVLGQYRSSDFGVINQHIKWAVEHGINGFIVGGMFQEENFRFLESEYAHHLWYACLEGIPQEGTGNWSDYRTDPVGWFSDRFTYLERIHFPRSNHLRIGASNRPVLYVYAAAHQEAHLITGISGARDSIQEDIYVIVDIDFWADPSRPTDENSLRELASAVDAITMYNPVQPFFLQRHPELKEPSELRRAIVQRYRDWSIAADEYGVDFIPTVYPGFNVTQAGDRAKDWPIIERSPEVFRNLCSDTRDLIDPEIDAAFVTTFNEWPEYTAIEPAVDHGTTYLEIVRTELAAAAPDFFEPDRYKRFTFEFNETVRPSELNDELDDDRELALALDELRFSDESGDEIQSFDLGVWGAEPVMLEGAWGREEASGERFRWLGGERKLSKLSIDADVSAAQELTIRAMPQVGNRIEAKMFLDGEEIDTIDFGNREFTDYGVSLEGF